MRFFKIATLLISSALSSYMLAQESYVLDNFAISQRYLFQNSSNSHLWSPNVGGIDVDELIDEKMNHWLEDIQDYNYLFSEDENWSIRVWRSVWLDFTPNECIKKGDYFVNPQGNTEFFGGLPFLELVRPILMPESEDLREVILYQTPDFYMDEDTSLWRGLYKELWDDVRIIKLKEDWHYDKKTGDFEKSIIGMGFYAPDGEGGQICLGWVYFPQIVWALSNHGVDLNGKYCTWTNYFRQNHFLASVDSLERTSVHHPSQGEYMVVPEYCNDLDAMWKLEELKHVMTFGQEDPDEEATRFHLNNHGEAFGKMVQGFPEGTWNLYNDKRKLILTVDFASGVEHGVFRSYDDEGDLIEKGHFAFGLREGEWITYHPNGQENTRRNYFRGWMRGKQVAFFDNGKQRLEYYYENHIIHGPFREWYRDGVVKQEGTMTNGIRTDQWNFNLRLPQDYIDYILNNGGMRLDAHWNEAVLKDRMLTYSCIVEQKPDPSFYKGVHYDWKLIGEIK